MNGKSKAGTVSEGKLTDMLRLQAEMNAAVNPKWLTAGYPYLRAAMIEGAEAVEHAGWKWWKKQERDLAQLRMELVDIWHFAMSDALVRNEGNLEEAAEWLLWDLNDVGRNHVAFDCLEYWLSDMDLISKIELLIGLAAGRTFDTALFQALLEDVDMTWDDLYRSYVGKNVLNRFRQDHGYKQGTYQKIWDGREDNEHLTEILSTLDHEKPGLRHTLYMGLAYRYGELVPQGDAQ